MVSRGEGTVAQNDVVSTSDSDLPVSVIDRDEEEKRPHVHEPTPVLQSTLFDRQRIINYTERFAQAQECAGNQNSGVARVILLELIKKYPDYPDAYIAIADSFSKTKDHGLAIEYYKNALALAPFDVMTETKLIIERNKFLTGSVNSLELSESLEEARKYKAKERTFRTWYHSRLRYRFIELGINKNSKLILTKTNDLDFEDIALSNGAVSETFSGLTALEHNKFELAEYYFERAIVKFEHDFIAWGGRVYSLLMTESFAGDEMAEVNQVIDKYHYALAYFTRFMMHYEADNDELAYQNLVLFMCDADMIEFGYLDDYSTGVLNLLQNYSSPDGSVITACDDVDGAADELKKVTVQIVSGQFTGDIDRLIRLINSLIHRYPTLPSNYSTRAIFYEYKNNLIQANLNNSLAIWLSDVDKLSINFYHRAKIFLKMGKVILADQNFERALCYLREFKKPDFLREEVKALHEFAELCLKLGKKHAVVKKYAYAEACFKIGIERKLQAIHYSRKGNLGNVEIDYSVSLGLYLECAKVMEEQEKSFTDIRDYIFKATLQCTYWDDKSIALLRAQYEFYDRKVQRARKHADLPRLVQPPTKIKPSPPAPKSSDKRNTFFNNKPQKPKAGIHNISYAVPEVDFKEIHLSEKQFEFQSEDRQDEEKKQDAERKKQEKKLKVREIKQLRLKQRKQNRTQVAESSDSDDMREIPTSSIEPEPSEIKKVELTEYEKNIFNMIMDVVPPELRKNYKLYLGGGWAYDKIRLKMLGLPINEYNDFDTVTNIPPMYLEKVFKQVPEVTGLHLLIIDNVKIDIVYEPNLDNLARIAKSRDFLSLFIDPEGNIHDPNGFAMSYMRRQKLYSSLPPAEIFKEDYLRIFRAIYTVSKRVPHFSTIKKQVALDKDFLVPRLINPEDGSIEKLLHPYRFNSWLGKLFSQRMAVKNFAFLIKFHILEILFPHIQQELYADMDWIKNQMLISNNSPFPKITLIYSTFIASALAQRVPVTYSQDCKIYRTEELMRAVIKIYKGSLLFKEAFKDVQELLTVLNRSLIEWEVQHEPTPPKQKPDEQQANRLTR